MNFNYQKIAWDNSTIPMKDTQLSVEALIEVNLSALKPKILRDEYSRAIKILDSGYDTSSLDDVIKAYENLHV
jgi:hypothetical protein